MSNKDQSLVLITGDQLSRSLSVLRQADPASCVILMTEVAGEATTTKHHAKKVALVFSAMRHFALELSERRWRVDYVKLEDAGNTQSLAEEVRRAKQRHGLDHAIMTAPNEFRVRQDLNFVTQLPDDRFFATEAEFQALSAGKASYRMEQFYRVLRQKSGLLMDGDGPVGGRWNFDADNRKPASGKQSFSPLLRFVPDEITNEVLALVAKHFSDHFGKLGEFWFAVTAEQAELALQDFLDHRLAHFGETQDAMSSGEAFMNHSVISMYLNLGLLDARDICKRAEQCYRKGGVPLAAAEGFIRQILGWREYVRGIYWAHMPGYVSVNALNATRPIPDFYWSGETDMNCVAQVIRQTYDEAYAHHIQRLMITGNFALLAGIDPAQVHDWYLAVYADAFEWVEMPNTIGMALHADGGLMASKPYAASANYINKMSDYCKSCRYDPKLRMGDQACPFNALYWNFIGQHASRWKHNPRMAQIVNNFQRFSENEKSAIKAQAERILSGLKPYA